MFELIVVEVTRSKRHDEVAQADQRGVRIGKQAHHHVVAEYLHGRLLSLLRIKKTFRGKILSGQLLTWHPVKSVRAPSHWPTPRLIPIPNDLNKTTCKCSHSIGVSVFVLESMPVSVNEPWFVFYMNCRCAINESIYVGIVQLEKVLKHAKLFENITETFLYNQPRIYLL